MNTQEIQHDIDFRSERVKEGERILIELSKEYHALLKERESWNSLSKTFSRVKFVKKVCEWVMLRVEKKMKECWKCYISVLKVKNLYLKEIKFLDNSL